MSYRPGVRAVLEALRRGTPIERRGIRTKYNPRSGMSTTNFFLFIGDHMATRANEKDVDQAHLHKLIEYSGGLSGQYKLTADGKKTYFDFKGNIVQKNWTPPTPKPPKWGDQAQAYLSPSTDTLLILDCQADRDAYRNKIGMRDPEPWLQTTGWNFQHELSASKRDDTYVFRSFQDWRSSFQAKDDCLSLVEAATRYGWEADVLREFEGWMGHYKGDEMGTIAVRQHGRWFIDDNTFGLSMLGVGNAIKELIARPLTEEYLHDHDIFDDYGSDEAVAAGRYLGRVKAQRVKEAIYFRAQLLIRLGKKPRYDIEVLEVRAFESKAKTAV